MNSAKIVVREMQRERSLQVRQFLAEDVGQPRESAAHHPQGGVLPLHVTGRDILAPRESIHDHLGSTDHHLVAESFDIPAEVRFFPELG